MPRFMDLLTSDGMLGAIPGTCKLTGLDRAIDTYSFAMQVSIRLILQILIIGSRHITARGPRVCSSRT
jgi:hypothetical protein